MAFPEVTTHSNYPAWLRQRHDLPQRVRSMPGLNVVDYTLRCDEAIEPCIKVALPVTFTPYASTQPCSARCVFCSENLRPQLAGTHSSQLRPAMDYFIRLRRALHAMSDLPMGLSLSGLEMTDRPDWLLRLLYVLGQHEVQARPFMEKILYSNGAGFGDAATRHELVAALSAFELERIEWSRHSHVQERNDRIMRFRPGTLIADDVCLRASIDEVSQTIPVTLVCILQCGGVSDISDVIAYLEWAYDIGVSTVVFREFALTGTSYRNNLTLRTLQDRRVSCEAVLRQLFESCEANAGDFTPIGTTEGYYFWNAEFRWRQQLRVVFETSDYTRMHALHASDTVYKLVYHANGHLTADWDPDTRVILKT